MEIQVNFLQAVARYQDAIFRLAYSYTKSQFDADDVTQNVLLKLYQTEQNFESEAHLKNWLMRVTVNQCKNLFRAPWRAHENMEDYANNRMELGYACAIAVLLFLMMIISNKLITRVLSKVGE